MPYKDPLRQQKAQHAHYLENKVDFQRRRAGRKAAIRDAAKAAKSRPCTDCGIEYPHYVMDLDHVRGKKVAGLAQAYKFASLQEALDEIAKCEPVCSNCHRERTNHRRETDKDWKWY